jgi:protein-disulfide isomerase
MNKFTVALVLLMLAGCISNESQVREAIRKDPKIVFDAIEENPEQFMESVNRAAQAARKKEYENRAAQIKAGQERDLKNPRQPVLAKERRLQGDDAAKIVVVEYADFQCPACRMAYESLEAFKQKYKGKFQFYYKNMPLSFHKMAMPSAIYFEAVRLQGNDKANKFYDYVFQRQEGLQGGDKFLKEAAKQAGADLKRLEKDLQSDSVKKTIEWDMKEFENFGFTGTPVVIVNGVALEGAPGFEDLERVVEQTSKR